ncbi:MAG TPA: hypothetical protein VGB82_16380 [Alphaproteobacteria bacterium]
MTARSPQPDAIAWAHKLHEAAAELRMTARRTAESLRLARRLERHAEAILFPQLPRWWAEPGPDPIAAAAGGDD